MNPNFRIYHLIKLEGISLFQDVWMQKTLIILLYCTNIDVRLI